MSGTDRSFQSNLYFFQLSSPATCSHVVCPQEDLALHPQLLSALLFSKIYSCSNTSPCVSNKQTLRGLVSLINKPCLFTENNKKRKIAILNERMSVISWKWNLLTVNWYQSRVSKEKLWLFIPERLHHINSRCDGKLSLDVSLCERLSVFVCCVVMDWWHVQEYPTFRLI